VAGGTIVTKFAAKAGQTIALAAAHGAIIAGAVYTRLTSFAILAKIAGSASVAIFAAKAESAAALAVIIKAAIASAVLAAIRAGVTIGPKVAV
jgi:hypothetical protein